MNPLRSVVPDKGEVSVSTAQDTVAADTDSDLINFDAAMTVSEKLEAVAALLEISAVEPGIHEELTTDPAAQAAALLGSIDHETLSNQDLLLFTDLLIQLNSSTVLDGEAVDDLWKDASYENGEIDSLLFNLDEIVLPEAEFDSTGLEEALKIVQLPPVPIVINSKVENAIRFFQTRGRKTFTAWLNRAGMYVPMMEPILEAEGIPRELVFLSMIESGFNPSAYSYAHAAGQWQFIASTGRIFGLKTDYWYDDRRDPVKSTVAAAKYLKKLYYDFDDWYLAIASYNCGEGRVKRDVRKYRTRDFWSLKKLPRQTRNYVPTYLAAMIIARNPSGFGFDEIEFRGYPELDTVVLTECVDFEVAARFVGISYDSLKSLNPTMIRWCTPPLIDSVSLFIPKGTKEQFADRLSKLTPEEKQQRIAHKVRRGETLSTIAEKYGTSVWALRSFERNNIQDKHKISVGQIIYVPIPSQAYKKSRSSVAYDDTPPPGTTKVRHTVKKGEVLSLIAEQYGVSLKALKGWNGLTRKKFIYPGQKLTIWMPEGRQIAAAPKPSPAKGDPKSASMDVTDSEPQESVSSDSDEINYTVYKMQKGDTLWDISLRNNVSIAELKRINKIRNHRYLRPGDEIKIPIKDKS